MNIENIELKLIEMSKRVIESLSYAFSLYFDPSKAKEINILDDKRIDELEREIEEMCLLDILKERPFATDLRKLTGYFKVSEDIERLGDHSEDIVWCNNTLREFKEEYRIDLLDLMIKHSQEMITLSFKSLLELDDNLGKKVIKMDDTIDKLYLEFLKDLPEFKQKYKVDDNFIIYFTLLAKYIERICDHATNISEWAIYIKTGFYKDRNII